MFRFVVEDSSGEAILYAGGVLVQAILRLSLKQWTDLEQLTCSAGTIVYVRNWHGRDNHWKVCWLGLMIVLLDNTVA